MKYTFHQQQQIIELKEKQYSSRAISKLLGISKSGVNDYYNSYLDNQTLSKNGPRVLLFDLETSAALVYCFGRHKQFINQDAIQEEGGKILCAGYHWLGEANTTVVSHAGEIKEHSDYTVCKYLWNLFDAADVVVAHNALGFDVRMLAARCIANGLPPLPKVKVLDTLQMARKGFRFPSNKLDSLGEYFKIGRKVSHSGIKLWVDVQQGSTEALNKMVEYCAQDVDLLYEVFVLLQKQGLASGVNFAAYYDDSKTRCKSCGSDNLEFTGKQLTSNTGIFDEVHCKDCGASHRSKRNKLLTVKRKNLLV